MTQELLKSSLKSRPAQCLWRESSHDGQWQLVLLWLRALNLSTFMQSEFLQLEQRRPSDAHEVQIPEQFVCGYRLK